MKKLSVIIIILFMNTVFAQNKIVPNPKYPSLFKTVPPISIEDPEWVHIMYSNTVNFNELQIAFDNYYKNKILEKNTHTQNYKYFVEKVLTNNYLQQDGSVYIPNSKEAYNKYTKQLLKQRGIANLKNQRMTLSTNSWESIGPFETYSNTDAKTQQANISVIDQSLSNPDIMFAGTDVSGLFKSLDKGLNWLPIGDDFFTQGSVSAISIDPTNENIVYIGRGRKLYKTVDGGVTWQEILDENSLNLIAITINPNNTQVIIIGGSNGVKRSTDGGLNWTTITTTRCWDLKLKTDNPDVVFLAATNATKNITSLYKSVDGGVTFEIKETGWFSPVTGVAQSNGGARIGVTDADANRIYVVLLGSENDDVRDNNYIGIYRSDDAGETWQTPYDGNGDGAPDNEPGGPYSSEHWCLTGFNVTATGYNQGYYDLDIEVSDTDPDKFLIGSLNLFKSENGGESYTAWGGYQCSGCTPGYRHPDIQEIEINGNDVWVASDGGIDYYDSNFNLIESRKKGINGANYWGFGQGWNEDVLVGGRYHNGNAGYYQTYGVGNFMSLGGAESGTGYVNQGENRKVYHSDIGGKLLPEVLYGGIQAIPNYSLYPNQSYIVSKKSEVVTDPNYWNTLYLGRSNKFWKSIDGGLTFDALHTFGTNADNIIMSIEISMNNSDLIYITQKNVGLWKTTDGGTTWTLINLPYYSYLMYISLNTEDELYVVLTNGNNTNKIFKTLDEGTTWVNLTSTVFDNISLRDICVQNGTDGGVYVSNGQSFWYKNNTMADWDVFSDGLPLMYSSRNIMIPFYRDSKMRTAGNRGIWERDFYESSTPKAQPMVKNRNIACYLDETQFEDHSILNHDGASWQWSFPGASYVSSTTVRNPIVKYPTYGDYDVTLTITDGAGNTDTKTIENYVHVGNDCNLSNLDSDGDTLLDSFESSVCTVDIPQSNNLTSGESLLITNFEGNLSSSYNANLNFYTACSNQTANIKLTVNLADNTILAYAYTHFGSSNTTDTILNNNSSEIISASSDFSQIAIELIDNAVTGEKNLIFKLLSNACDTTTRLDNSCIGNLDYDNDGILNYLDTDSDNDGLTDQQETQVCGNTIDTTGYYNNGEEIEVIDFGTSLTGVYFTTIQTKTTCYNTTNKLKARIDLDQQTISVFEYSHFNSNATDDAITGNGTNEVVTGSTSFCQVKYKLVFDNAQNRYKFIVEQVQNACGGRLKIYTNSCWSSLDVDENGYIDYLDNETLNVDSYTNEFSKIIPYPNPVNNHVLRFKNINTSYLFKLYSITGKELIKKVFNVNEKINLDYLKTGTYIYQIETDSTIENGKIIINNK